jgi:glutathione synthase/RimK-type ligase-like ATP-grasp enzyme
MIYAHNDNTYWGKQVVMAAGRAGVECKLFSCIEEVPEGAFAFVRLDQQGPQREKSKDLVAQLNARGVKTLPTAEEAILYDDKYAQFLKLGHHMPRTVYEEKQQKAAVSLKTMSYPFVSKAKGGAGSANVRLITNEVQAKGEILKAFSSGVPISYNRKQRGYVLWQEFVAGNDCDYRVCVAGDDYFGLVRRNRKDVPFASGSGNFYPLTLATDREKAAFAKAVEVAGEMATKLMAFDIVFDEDDPVLLEVSSSWTPYAYIQAPCFDRNMKPTGRTGAHLFDLIAGAMTC